jgi:hypothetical protein
MSSPNSRKSATRPAFSRFWLNSSAGAGDADLLPEALADLRDDAEGLLEAGLVAGHAAVVPHHQAELAVELVDGALAVDAEQALGLGLDLGDRLLELGVVGVDLGCLARPE